MSYRSRVGRRSSRRQFSRNSGSRRVNYSPPPMRGGIRL